MTHPCNVKGVMSFLGHDGVYRRFIKVFSKISKPFCNLLNQDVDFDLNDDCLAAYHYIAYHSNARLRKTIRAHV